MARIKQIEYTDQYIDMMDMEVEDAHCFYANGILVHNCSQEMLVLGNLAQEPTLLDPIRNGEDIHKAVATKMFGHYDKTKRTQAKNINFCSNYGGGASTIANRLGIHIDEAKALLEKYKKAIPRVTEWQERQIKQGRQEGIVYSYFGRPRYLAQYFGSADRSKRSYAERCCKNTPIQGCIPAYTRILTKDGYVPIGEFTVGEVWNGVCWTLAERKYKGYAQLVKITTEDGQEFYCDARHKLKVASKDSYYWKHINALNVGDSLCVNHADCGIGTDPDFYSYLLGVIVGDGHFTERFRSSAKGWDRDISIAFGRSKYTNAYRIKERLTADGYEVHMRYIYKDGYKDPVLNLTVYQRALIDKLKALGLIPNQHAWEKTVPASVYSKGFKSFLRGLYDTDGIKTGDTYSFHMTSKRLLDEVALLVNQHGFSTRLYPTGKPSKENHHQAYKLDVRGHNLVDWLKHDGADRSTQYSLPTYVAKQFIDSGCTDNSASYPVIRRRVLKGGSCSLRFMQKCGFTPSEYYHTTKVKSIEYLNKSLPMYTLATEHPLHQFVTEGLISKNTGGDIIRIAICKYWNKYLTDAEFRENVMFANTVHDEINLYVKKEWAHKAFLALKGLMEMHPKGWQLPLRVSPSVGTSWGAQIEMTNVSEDGVWTPDVELDEDLKLLESDK